MSSTSKARQRIQSLLDANSFVEIGALVKARATDFNMAAARESSDGVITGYGLIDGRLVYVYSQDADVLGGSIGEMHAKKIVSLYNLALRTGAPVIGMIDSSGLRLQEGIDALEAFGEIYAKQAQASGIIPQISAIFGNCGGGLALFPAMTDFTLMEKDASLFVNSPNALAGNREEVNNTAAADKKAAAGDVDFVGTEEEIFAQIRYLAGMLPSNNEDDASAECMDDLNRVCASAAAFVEDPCAAMTEIADGGVVFETKKGFAKEMFTCIATLGGNTVGIAANRGCAYDENGEKAEEFGNALTTAGCAKAAALVRFCDAFDIPVITNVITKRAGGSAYAVMNSKALGADLTFAYTDASVGILEGKYAASVLCDGSADEVKAAAKAYDELQNSIEAAAARGVVDQIIAPEDVRKYLIGAVEMLYSKREALPSRKHASI